jgi:DNA-binding IscR family transcriptional regulator
MPAKEITLYHIVEAVDGGDFLTTCVLGFRECSGSSPCAVHEKWASLRENVYQMLVGKNIAQLAAETQKPGYKL